MDPPPQQQAITNSNPIVGTTINSISTATSKKYQPINLSKILIKKIKPKGDNRNANGNESKNSSFGNNFSIVKISQIEGKQANIINANKLEQTNINQKSQNEPVLFNNPQSKNQQQNDQPKEQLKNESQPQPLLQSKINPYSSAQQGCEQPSEVVTHYKNLFQNQICQFLQKLFKNVQCQPNVQLSLDGAWDRSHNPHLSFLVCHILHRSATTGIFNMQQALAAKPNKNKGKPNKPHKPNKINKNRTQTQFQQRQINTSINQTISLEDQHLRLQNRKINIMKLIKIEGIVGKQPRLAAGAILMEFYNELVSPSFRFNALYGDKQGKQRVDAETSYQSQKILNKKHLQSLLQNLPQPCSQFVFPVYPSPSWLYSPLISVFACRLNLQPNEPRQADQYMHWLKNRTKKQMIHNQTWFGKIKYQLDIGMMELADSLQFLSKRSQNGKAFSGEMTKWNIQGIGKYLKETNGIFENKEQLGHQYGIKIKEKAEKKFRQICNEFFIHWKSNNQTAQQQKYDDCNDDQLFLTKQQLQEYTNSLKEMKIYMLKKCQQNRLKQLNNGNKITGKMIYQIQNQISTIRLNRKSWLKLALSCSKKISKSPKKVLPSQLLSAPFQTQIQQKTYNSNSIELIKKFKIPEQQHQNIYKGKRSKKIYSFQDNSGKSERDNIQVYKNIDIVRESGYPVKNGSKASKSRKSTIFNKKKYQLEQYISNLCQSPSVLPSSFLTFSSPFPKKSYKSNPYNPHPHSSHKKYPFQFTPQIHINSQKCQQCTMVYKLKQINAREITLKFVRDRRKWGIARVKILVERDLRGWQEGQKDYQEKNRQKLFKIMQILSCLGATVIVEEEKPYHILENKENMSVQIVSYLLNKNVQKVLELYNKFNPQN